MPTVKNFVLEGICSMNDKPWPQEWCDSLPLYQLENIAAMKQPTFLPIDHPAKRMGKFLANIAYIKFCLKQNLKLIIGTSNQQKLINDLQEHFPTALFVLVGEWGVEIRIRKREELE